MEHADPARVHFQPGLSAACHPLLSYKYPIKAKKKKKAPKHIYSIYKNKYSTVKVHSVWHLSKHCSRSTALHQFSPALMLNITLSDSRSTIWKKKKRKKEIKIDAAELEIASF